MKPEMIKNIIIGILAILCLVLAGLIFSSEHPTGQSAGQVATLTEASSTVSSTLTKDSKKLDPSSVIRMATIEGISLATKLEEVDSAAKKAGFTCTKTQPSAGQANWSCKHDNLESTTLTISATGEKIASISRNGAIILANVAPTMNMIEDLKFLLNTRKGIRFSQSDDIFSLSVKNQTEKNQEDLDYNIMNQRFRDEKNPQEIKSKLIYSATISAL